MKAKKEKEQAEPSPDASQAADTEAASQPSLAPPVPKAEYDSLVETLQRLQAEFENYKKRVGKEQAEFGLHANAELLRQFLSVLDNLELALNHATPAERQEGLYKGVELIYAQLLDLLEANGVGVIQPAQGERFDPYRHEAMLTEQRDGSERNTVLETLQKGYTLQERVLRTAKVKVAK